MGKFIVSFKRLTNIYQVHSFWKVTTVTDIKLSALIMMMFVLSMFLLVVGAHGVDTFTVVPNIYDNGSMGIDVKFDETKGTEITAITMDQPGLQVGDFIISIAGNSLLNMSEDDQKALWG